jgi:hypothetical protein
VPWHKDDVLISQARSTASHLLGLLLPEMDDRHWKFRPRIYVRLHWELVLLAKRATHMSGYDGILVLYMVSMMNANASDASGVVRQCHCGCTNAGDVLTMSVLSTNVGDVLTMTMMF